MSVRRWSLLPLTFTVPFGRCCWPLKQTLKHRQRGGRRRRRRRRRSLQRM
jgi:hypothetical protein